MKIRKIIFIPIILVLIVLGFIIKHHFSAANKGKLTDPIKRADVIEGVYGIGTVMANKSFQLKSGVTNIIRNIFVKEGDSVKTGQKIIEIEGVVTKAPFDGVVTYLPFKIGEAVFPQGTIVTITDLMDRYLVVSLEQQGALRVRTGQKAKLSFESMRDKVYEGVVESVYSNENNFLARIGIATLPAQILPGMTADVAIGIKEHKNVLTVPVAALEDGHVYVKRNYQSPEKIKVKTGIVDGVMAEIVSGDVKEGERLLIREKVGQ